MPPTKLDTKVSRHGDWTVLVLDGEVDMASAPRLEEALAGQLEAGTACLIVDLRQVTFMDSTGLTVLFRSHEAMAARGFEMVLVCSPGAVRRVIEVSGVGGVVPIHDDPAELAAS